MAQVWELDLPQGEKFVLLAFADHADDEGVCRPSVERVAWKTGYEQRQVKRIGKKLRESGLLDLLKPARPERGLAAEYRICARRGLKLAPFHSVAGDKMSSAAGDIAGLGRGHFKPSAGDIAVSPQPSVRTIKSQPSKEESSISARSTELFEGILFVTWWDSYPRKLDKLGCQRLWAALSVLDRAAAFEGVEAWKTSTQWQDEKFIPHPATFLKRRQWEDVPVKASGQKGAINADERTRRNIAAAGL